MRPLQSYLALRTFYGIGESTSKKGLRTLNTKVCALQHLECRKGRGWRLREVESRNPPSLGTRMKHVKKQSICFGGSQHVPTPNSVSMEF